MFEKIKNFFKKPLYIIILIIILAIAGYRYFSAKSDKSLYQFSTIQRGTILQEVSVTGRVKPAQAVDLSFERGGKMARINVAVGDKVNAGQVLAVLENNDLAAQVSQARASLAVQQATLDGLKIGTRTEEMQIAQTNVTTAQKSLTDAQNNLVNVKNKADVDLNNLYNGVKNTLNDAYINADDAVNKQIDDLFTNDTGNNPKLTFYTGSQASSDAESKRQTAGAELVQLKQELDALPTDKLSLDLALAKGENHLKVILNFLNTLSAAINESAGLTSAIQLTYKGYINTGRTNVIDSLTNISDKIQDIAAQKAANQSNVSTAETSVNSAGNSLKAYQDQLALKQAGSTPEQINAQAAQVQSAQANLENAQAQLGKTIITSPISGIVTQQNNKVGEIITQNAVIISIISAAQFEIEADIPEADIAKVKINDIASVSLDAYGNNIIFDAKVIKINPAETIIDGVATYKTTFQLIKEDERVKSGMTANIDILTAKKTDVLVIPQRAIFQRGNEQFVQLNAGQNKLEERKVIIGLKGSDGNVEIISGLNANDQIVSLSQTTQ